MGHGRSRRLRLLDGLCRTMSDMLHDRIERAARERGLVQAPLDTSAIYTMAMVEEPALLDQLLLVCHRARQERGEVPRGKTNEPPRFESERKRMLSALRATVRRVRQRV